MHLRHRVGYRRAPRDFSNTIAALVLNIEVDLRQSSILKPQPMLSAFDQLVAFVVFLHRKNKLTNLCLNIQANANYKDLAAGVSFRPQTWLADGTIGTEEDAQDVKQDARNMHLIRVYFKANRRLCVLRRWDDLIVLHAIRDSSSPIKVVIQSSYEFAITLERPC